MAARNWLLSTTSITTLVVGLPAAALAADLSGPAPADLYSAPASLPAVSAVNGKIGTFVGDVSNNFAVGVSASLAFPLSHSWGAQIDGMFGTAGGAFYGIGGHVFWRDPSRGLVGAYASYVGWGTSSTVAVATPTGGFADVTGANVGKIGIEGESYMDRWSLEGLAAYQFGTNSGFAGRATIAYYLTDDFRFDLSARYLQGVGGIGSAGIEWAPQGVHFSLFADAAVGANSYSHLLGGMKWYFGGEQKSLIRRHREDDPENPLPHDLHKTMGNAYCDEDSELFDGVCEPLSDGT